MLPLGLERGGLLLAVNPVQPVDQRMNVRVDRVGGRHREDPGTVAALLVFVEPDRGEPVVPEQVGRHPAFALGEQVHVPVVVVADVVVVEIRERARLVGCAEVLVVPVGHHDLPVGVERRHQQENYLVENLAGRR